MTKPAIKKINLALQGGGAHGAISWGVIDRLLEDDRIQVGSISGASAGAVNAAALAYGIHLNGSAGGRQKLEELWRTISEVGSLYSPVRQTPWDFAFDQFGLNSSMSYNMFDAFTRMFSPYQFNPFDLNPLREVLERCINFDELRQCDRTQLFISATNVRTGKVHVFNTEDVSLDVISASTCLPFLFKAVEIDGETYWDGGYMGNPVLFPFFYKADSADIVIVHVNPMERNEIPKTAPEIMNRINEISFNSSLMRELRAISFVDRLLDSGWLKDEYRDRLRNIRIHSIRSDGALENLSVASKFRVDWEFLTDLKDRGRQIADTWLGENFDAIGKRSSVNLRRMFGGNLEPHNPDSAPFST